MKNTQHSLGKDGFEIVYGVLDDLQVVALREAADAVASSAGSACVRHLRSRSEVFNALSVSELVLALLPDEMRPVRSILFDKTPDENWPVSWHRV